jgi:hypothetical protein
MYTAGLKFGDVSLMQEFHKVIQNLKSIEGKLYLASKASKKY